MNAVGSVSIQPNLSTLPFAFFPRAVAPAPDAADALSSLASLDPADRSIVSGPPPDVSLDPSASATVLEDGRGDDHLTLRYRTTSPGLLRVAIAAYPGWHAALNGVELPILTVDRALLGVVVPAGSGELRLWYAPRYFWPAAAISALSLATTLAILLFSRSASARR